MIYAKHIGEPERKWLLEIPGCESSYNPDAVSGPNDGLYQWNIATWDSTPYAKHSPFSAYWSAFAAHWGYHHLEHGPGEWACTSILGLG